MDKVVGHDEAAREGKRRAVAAAMAKEGLALVYPFTPCPNHRCSQSTSKQLKKSRQLLCPTPPSDLAQFSFRDLVKAPSLTRAGDEMTIDQLRRQCEDARLSAAGLKTDLIARLVDFSMDLSVFPAEALEFSAWTEQQWQGRLEELAARSPDCFQVQPCLLPALLTLAGADSFGDRVGVAEMGAAGPRRGGFRAAERRR